MADPPLDDDTRDDATVEADQGPRTGTSRWQKVVGIIGLLVILWVGNQMVGQLTGRGPGPGGGGGGPGQHAPPSEIQDQETDMPDGGGHRPPEGRP